MNAPISYEPDFMPKDVADNAFAWLRENLAWLSVTEARKEYWTNDLNAPYTYGGGIGQRTYESQPAVDLIEKIKWMAREFWQSAEWEGCFLNYYEEGKNALGWHADDAKTINHNDPIAVVSLGAPRPIMFRPIGDKDPKNIVTKTLEHGSLLMMHPGMQHSWLHKIPKGHENTGPRISLTYRSLKTKDRP